MSGKMAISPGFPLYLITDRKLFPDTDRLLEAITEALRAGVRAVQLREKDLPTTELLALAYRLREITSNHQAKLFINDRADIALCVQADGVHLGHNSMPAHAVRNILSDRYLIGVSAHSHEEALEAEKWKVDYITFGPVYATPSKMRYGNPPGTAGLKQVVESVSIPVFGIGGIKPENTAGVIGAGASGIAVISGILAEPDIPGSVIRYLKALHGENQ